MSEWLPFENEIFSCEMSLYQTRSLVGATAELNQVHKTLTVVFGLFEHNAIAFYSK